MNTGALTGRTLGRHVVLEKIAQGGMGVVYEGRDTRLGRLVALKVLPPETFSDDAARVRFLQEARTASSLNHPNIVTIYEVDRADDVDFIAMELVEGRTVADLAADRRVGTREKLEIASQVADALAAAHAAGIVHRDLKPANIMVTRDGRAKVLDFGLARSKTVAAHAGETTTAVTAIAPVAGTVPYMSPEQAAGRPADARSDIFSFGCVLYELLSGCRAFRGETNVEAVASLMRDSPAPIRGVDAVVMRIVDRCLAKAPADRYQSAAELKSAIDSVRTTGASKGDSIAVLPPVNLGGGAADDYLCEGLAESIIGALSGVPELRVIARTSAFTLAREGLDAREIGSRLGVAHVLEGSVHRAGARVRVNVRLVDTEDGAQEWSERYDHESLDFFALEDAISDAVCRRLRKERAGGRAGRLGEAIQPAAHQAFLEGRYHFARGGPPGLARAKSSFERALALEPAFALACDSLAEVHWFLGFYGVVPPREAFAQSTWLALRALELDDSLGETHALLGMLRKELDYNWPEVRRELQRAMELNAASPAIQIRYAICSPIPSGDLAEAEGAIRRALDVDPLSLDVRWWLAVTMYLERRYPDCVDIARQMIDLDPSSPLGHNVAGMALGECGALDEAIAAEGRAFELSGGAGMMLGFAGMFHGRAGRLDAARATLARLERASSGGYLPPFSVALIHIGLGDWNEALMWMHRAIDERDPIIMPIKTFPFLDPIRSDPRYAALLQRMNLS